MTAVGDINCFEPLALEYLSAGVKDSHNVKIHDMRLEKNLQDVLAAFPPDIVGITGYTSQVNTAKKVLESVKEFNKDILTVVGGHHATVAPDDFNDESVDIIVIGEGVMALRDLVSTFENKGNFEEVKGIAIRKDGELIRTVAREYTPLDELPFPDRTQNLDHRKHYKIGNHGPIALMRNSIGCKFKCLYCVQWKLTGGKYLSRNPEDVVKELSMIKEPYVYFADDETFLDIENAHALADLIEKAGIKKNYHLFTRADTIAKHPDLIKKWRKLGLTDVIVGFECFTDEELKYIRKGTDTDINEAAIRVLHENKIVNHATFMIMPDYDHEQFMTIRKFIRKHKYVYPKFPIITPFPGTDLFEQNKSKITSFNYDYYDFKHVLLPTKLPLKEFYREYAELHRKAIPLWLNIVRLFRFRFKEIIPTIIKSRKVINRIRQGYTD